MTRLYLVVATWTHRPADWYGIAVLEASTKEHARVLAEAQWPDTPHTVRPATVQTGQQLRWLRDANTADAARAVQPTPTWALRGWRPIPLAMSQESADGS
jgi:hypothetical protein